MEILKTISGKTKIMGIIGNPVEHSISPYLHNTISREVGFDAVYVPFPVCDSLENAVKGLKAINAVGFNVTIPYKKDVMKFLDENSKEALLMGAVNTVKNIEGRLYGYNTDAEGFSRSFREETGDSFRGKRVFIIGAGGATRAIAVKIAIEGAEKIYIANRTVSKAAEIADIINGNIKDIASSVDMDKKASEVFHDSSIIINTTSVGMWPHVEKSPLTDEYTFLNDQIVYDAIYNPCKTKLLLSAEEAGCKTVNGLGMLFYQGVNAYEIWTGLKLEEEFLRELFLSFKEMWQ